ncbi:M14-type cytosolic carboxypeptidase [Labilibaculum sp. DW002]|uniref:M14-type cytosolic carboxypeptidase n=1 Tax=Paralabilibaculum antarcticum TaxID=2912572 RepID=A0ABT5VX83_9BACT|nr:M14-type cytosolic carboxypeptidase [Labilibaculum sp. DW002]MDE5419382.1 M14-type cytosolic carboxypeptidase [Labilibaculum sp. DW002]
MNISSNFDGGKIKVVDATNPQDIQLSIPNDTNSEHFQWFYFRLMGAQEEPVKMRITNASGASYPEGYNGYSAVASYDKETWFRVPSSYDGKELVIEHTPEFNSVFYAYFAPYSYDQHLNLVHNAQLSPECELVSIGETIQGRDIDMLIVGEPAPEKKKVWVIARQHPGESMAEWFMEGFIGKLLDEDDAVSRTLLNKAVFYIVPNINVDGSIAGNLRVNTKGFNYNREWAEPSIENSPEVYHVRNMMDQVGCDLNLDIHGDEDLPYNFISSIEGIPSFDERLKNLLENFTESWKASCPDFQDTHGYPKNEPGKANLAICSKHIGERYKCLSLTVEMPFKDNNDLPDPEFGWSPERSILFGESVLQPIYSVVDNLR